MIKELEEYCRRKAQRRYRRWLMEYTPEKRRLISKGRHIAPRRTSASKEKIEYHWGIKTEVAERERPWDPESIAYGGYNILFDLGEERADLDRWLELGKLEADFLVECCSVGPDGGGVYVGRPLRIIGLDKNFDVKKTPPYILKKLGQRGFI